MFAAMLDVIFLIMAATESIADSPVVLVNDALFVLTVLGKLSM